MTLHANGSGNPLGVGTNSDKLPMHPYFIFKDLVTLIAGIAVLAALVFYAPNVLGHSDNYIMANPLSYSFIDKNSVYLLHIYCSIFKYL